MSDLDCFKVEIPHDNPEKMRGFSKFINNINDANDRYIERLVKDLDITYECAADVWYLRTRSRHTVALEERLIQLHREGNPPNVMNGDF